MMPMRCDDVLHRLRLLLLLRKRRMTVYCVVISNTCFAPSPPRRARRRGSSALESNYFGIINTYISSARERERRTIARTANYVRGAV